MHAIHQKAVSFGTNATEEQLRDAFHQHALRIYHTVPIVDGIQQLGNDLVQRGFAIGIVSASPSAWMRLVIERLQFKDNIKKIIFYTVMLA